MRKNNKKNTTKLLWILLLAAAVLVVALLTIQPATKNADGETESEEISAATEETADHPVQVLNDALRIDEIGDYTGMYVEDGSDEGVSDLLMMIVTNITDEPIQYAQIELDLNGKTAQFTLSVLPAGASAILLEQNRMEYSADVDYYAAKATCTSLAGFNRALTKAEDKLEIHLMDGGANIHNISGVDIPDDIVICYKNVARGLYHGGIAYRIRLEGGLQADEIRQIMTNHMQESGTEIMFVEIEE